MKTSKNIKQQNKAKKVIKETNYKAYDNFNCIYTPKKKKIMYRLAQRKENQRPR